MAPFPEHSYNHVWLTGLIAYAVVCVVLGRTATPLMAGILGAIGGTLVGASAQMPWGEVLSFLIVPLAGAWLMAGFLHQKVRAQDAAGGACASLCGIVGLVFQSWIPMMLTLALTLLVIRMAKRWPRKVTLVSTVATTTASVVAAAIWTGGI